MNPKTLLIAVARAVGYRGAAAELPNLQAACPESDPEHQLALFNQMMNVCKAQPIFPELARWPV
jgi:hypothetical protein